jgi:hypothetical protein
MTHYALAKFDRATGLSNRLFIWARAYLHCVGKSAQLIAPKWTEVRRGPILRGGLLTGGLPILSIPGKIWLFANFDPRAYESAPKERLEFVTENEWRPGVRAVVFSGYGDLFTDLRGQHEVLRKELTRIVTQNVRNQVDATAETPIVLNVRLGRDFRIPKAREEQGGFVLTPIGWFIKALQSVRREIGSDAPALVVSDGTPRELEPLLAEPAVKLARTRLAAVDLLLLSRARYLIGTGGSSFTAWGGFLSQADVVTVEGHSMKWFNLDKASTRSVRTIPLG